MAGLLFATVAYQLSQVERLQRINREVSLITMEGSRISIRLLQSLDGVQEFAQKFAVLPDPDYQTQWREWEAAVEEDLQVLSEVGFADREEDVRIRIEEGWAEYRSVAPSLIPGSVTVLPFQLLSQIQALLGDLRIEAEELIAVNEAVIAEQAESSTQASERARFVAWISAGSALSLAALLSFLLYRSISGPLKRLTRGTREIARGRFQHRLRVHGPRELSSLAKDFDRMAARLDELETLKRDFVSHVSHELKTPLAAIQETIEVLLEELPGPLTSKQAHLLELSRSSSGRLSGMISDLLETSRMEAGTRGFVPAVHDASDLIVSVLDEMQPVAEERGLQTSLTLDVGHTELLCDRNRMREVVANLVGNAIKFSPTGGRIRLFLSELDAPPAACPQGQTLAQSEEGPFLLLSVRDKGPGVPDRHKNGIFEKFHQVRRGERLRGQGVGLGLAIASRIVLGHGGAIWVEDGIDRGSIFQVLVPKVPAQWRGEIELATVEPATVKPETAAPTSARRRNRTGKVALSLVILGAVSGCAASMPEAATIAMPIPDPAPEPVSVLAGAQAPTEVSFSPAEIRLVTGWSFLAEAEHVAAYEQFLSVMRDEDSAQHTGEAVWAMALLHLFPSSPFQDLEWAATLLDYLRVRFPNDGLGIQAAWVQALLGDLDAVQVMIDQQEQALQRLTETVDQLKSIDLNRAPAGAPDTRRDAPFAATPDR